MAKHHHGGLVAMVEHHHGGFLTCLYVLMPERFLSATTGRPGGRGCKVNIQLSVSEIDCDTRRNEPFFLTSPAFPNTLKLKESVS